LPGILIARYKVIGSISTIVKMRRKSMSGIRIITVALSVALVAAGTGRKPNSDRPFQVIPVARVPASFPVNFALFTYGEKQYVAFYDTAHWMTIACRNLKDRTWDFERLDSKVVWDSHNYLAMTVDDKGTIHLAGNMHSSQLIYYRSTKSGDIHSMKGVHRMTGRDEDVTTYPVFMHGPDHELIFHYRYGRSGSGYEVFNVWNSEKMQWSRLQDKPLTDGQGKMNAYMQGPLPGPDGYYHLLWVWRNTPDCATNHTLSYARSKDLLHWESIRGEQVALPLTIEYKELYVDTTPIHGGLINIGIRIGFDRDGKVLIGYHKYDKSGNTQLFLARFTHDVWVGRQITDWNYRWDFKGYGTIDNELLIESPKPSAQRRFIIFGYHHIKYGDGQVVVKHKTFEPVAIQDFETTYPAAVDNVRSSYPGMVVNKIFDAGWAAHDMQYLLRWETLAPNRDQARQGDLPPDTMLEVIAF
jgi:hypothetical protein